ncbi:transcription factor mef2A [Episyrphus balteatus]|uniref:transcription factor mef2A n=1 Tax=Episyrphus balteatus TaxID=286459 RepID=UPI002485CB34|nr:transcription factor mef2A [Episyrphus balteatus]
MMTGLMDKRKRSREDDFCESTPLSKRINNLHINNNNLEESFHNHQHHQHHNHQNYNTSNNMGMQNIQQHINHNMQQQQYPNQVLHHHNPNQVPQQDDFQQYSYDPELSEHENPFYYNKNKLLHELHFERVKRNQI